MTSRLAFIQRRLAVNLGGQGSVASDLTVCWTLQTGGDSDPGTGGQVGGTETLLSGTTRAYGHEAEPKHVLRLFAEIATGDLILDLAPEPQVTLFPDQAQSGRVPLESLAGLGLRYVWNGRYYVSKEVTPDLQSAWDAYVGNRRLHRTLLLKREI